MLAGKMKTPASGSDCQSCGACCFSSLETYVRVSGDDWTRLGGEADQVAHFIGHRAYLRMDHGHCTALAVTRTCDGHTHFTCSIYDRRPQVCRDLVRGSPSCEAERMVKAAWAAGAPRPPPSPAAAACG